MDWLQRAFYDQRKLHVCAGREHQAAAKVQPVQLDTRFSFNNYTVRRQLILTPAAVCKSKPACYELLHSLAQLSSEAGTVPSASSPFMQSAHSNTSTETTVWREMLATMAHCSAHSAPSKQGPSCSLQLQRTGAEHASQPTGIFATGSMSR